ncbi:alpha-1,2-fucosyltransferase [Halobacteriovorax sp. CON-3]|uniref:alpha-1,2-fucosyltransferase n=1 Tax=Halobacteriovorax sp. CON-3 TaxID=3157710 RepID=UPI0037237924
MLKQTVFIKGGMGNQLFQLSYYLFLLKKNKRVNLNIEYYNRGDRRALLDIFDNKKHSCLVFCTQDESRIKYFFSRVLNKLFKNKNISFFRKVTGLDLNYFLLHDGYWHEYELAYENRSQISSLLFSDLLESKDFEYDFENVAALHIRRGDYLNVENYKYQTISSDYYYNAILRLKEKNDLKRCIVFSDDREWCLSNLKLPLNFEVFDESLVLREEFYCLSKFKNIVISNSTFSWWAAVLGQDNKNVVCPLYWERGLLSSDYIGSDNWDFIL